jgi:Na+-transporting NADH:ubiquinone oxidoreductase subunit NqrC
MRDKIVSHYVAYIDGGETPGIKLSTKLSNFGWQMRYDGAFLLVARLTTK